MYLTLQGGEGWTETPALARYLAFAVVGCTFFFFPHLRGPAVMEHGCGARADGIHVFPISSFFKPLTALLGNTYVNPKPSPSSYIYSQSSPPSSRKANHDFLIAIPGTIPLDVIF